MASFNQMINGIDLEGQKEAEKIMLEKKMLSMENKMLEEILKALEKGICSTCIWEKYLREMNMQTEMLLRVFQNLENKPDEE
ncbi:hypothetical protein R3W88_028957 [Solanum pinnatisectum]|uniref:Uncharacterized protein n=1 Tax=Solanum pinnatisectum TaxID=50273 RepID=A0AAV9K461_9SOLN|nr:hypothetical protein R3W88_028957 [Solanum pinnatisectum]